MAIGACRVLGADVAVAVTGVAGPDEQEGEPVGTVFLGLCIDGESRSRSWCACPAIASGSASSPTISVLDLLRRRLLAGLTPWPRLFVAVLPAAPWSIDRPRRARPARRAGRALGAAPSSGTSRCASSARRGESTTRRRRGSSRCVRRSPTAVTSGRGSAASAATVVCVPVAGLDELAAAVPRPTAAIGEPPDPRRFAGHLTLARLRRPGRVRCRWCAVLGVGSPCPSV